MIFFNIAAIHTTSSVRLRVIYSLEMTYRSTQLLSHVLFNLATYPSYIEPLREEISAVIKAEGWTKAATESMRKLDSFMKESQRLHGSDAGKSFQIYNSKVLVSLTRPTSLQS